MRPRELRSAALVFAGVTSTEIGSAFATRLLERVSTAEAVLLRTLFAALALSLVRRAPLSRLRGTVLVEILALGLLVMLLNLFFFSALARLPLGIAVAVELTGPLTLAALGSKRSVDLLWPALAAAGILLLVPELGSGIDPVGIGFGLLAAACWAGYIVVAARLSRGPLGISSLPVALAVAAVLVAPLGLAHPGASGLLEPDVLALGAVVALLGSAIPYVAEMKALRNLTAATFGVLLSLGPALAALIGAVALDQSLGPAEIGAITLVVAASAGALSRASGETLP